jgi:hypothetical protein
MLRLLFVKYSIYILQVNAPSPSNVILVSEAIKQSESFNRIQQRSMVEKLLAKLA